MSDSEEERRMKKLKRDAKDKFQREDEYNDKPPRGRHDEDIREDDD